MRRSLVIQTCHQVLARLDRPRLLALCLGLVGILGAIDHATGYELSFSVFYALPVAVASWYGSYRTAQAVALTSAVVWLAVDLASGHWYSHAAIPFWNGLVRLGFFVTIAHLICTIRALMGRERDSARTDTLTGLANTRGFIEGVEPLLDLARRYGHTSALCYVDLDHFKTVNDSLGHDAGDAVLKTVAATLVGAVRSTDRVARLGGDEFALFLPETGRAGAEQTSRQLCDRIRQQAREHGWPITASVGVTVLPPPPPPLRAALKAADDLMYRAKQAGKDEVVVEELPAVNPPAEQRTAGDA